MNRFKKKKRWILIIFYKQQGFLSKFSSLKTTFPLALFYHFPPLPVRQVSPTRSPRFFTNARALIFWFLPAQQTPGPIIFCHLDFRKSHVAFLEHSTPTFGPRQQHCTRHLTSLLFHLPPKKEQGHRFFLCVLSRSVSYSRQFEFKKIKIKRN